LLQAPLHNGKLCNTSIAVLRNHALQTSSCADTADTTQSLAVKSIKSLMPLLDRVLVQRVKAEAKTAGGIFLPESSVKELNEAKVLAVGPGGVDKDGKRIPMSVQPGDKVVIPQYGGSSLKVGDDEFHILRDHEYVFLGIADGGRKS
jgi:chaperonin GroES